MSTNQEEFVLDLTIEEPAVSARRLNRVQAPKMIVGYCWPWTARAGDQIDFKISTQVETNYQADLVRIVCGDSMSEGNHFKEERVPATFAGRYPGRHQATHLGSFVRVPPNAALDRIKSFTIQVMLFATCLPSRRRSRASTIEFDEQHLISRWDSKHELGWALLIDRDDRLGFRIGGPSGVQYVALSRPITERRWYLAVASLDADHKQLTLALQCIASSPAAAMAEPTMELQFHYSLDSITQAGALYFAACAKGAHPDMERQHYCFNGRLDRPRISSCAMDLEAARSLCGPELPAHHSAAIGFWDGSRDIEGTFVRDLSGNSLHGTVVNSPMRAVAGVDWDGSASDWRQKPQHYSAIHFHDDDLYDAQWQTDFSFRIPEDLPSGVYAAHLRQGQSEDYIPFFVAPPRGTARAPVALLLPTLSYTAYANIVFPSVRIRTLRNGPDGKLRIEHEGLKEIQHDDAHVAFLVDHFDHLGAGVYMTHTDGTLRTFASQKHLNMSIKPKGMNWTLVADTYLTAWLHHRAIPYDIITDDLLNQEGCDLLRRYRVVMTGNHPEYYTMQMWNAVADYQRTGGRWMYLGGNGFFWVTSTHSQLPGLIEVRKHFAVPPYERRHAFDGVNGGRWRDNGRPPQQLMGVGTSGIAHNNAGPYRRLPDSYDARAAFIFEGVHSDPVGNFGIIGGGAAGQEVDRMALDLGTPVHALHLARADPLPPTHAEDGESVATADMVFFELPRGGAVFSVGSMSWVGSLSHNSYVNDISRITENVLRRFMDERPFEFRE